MSRFEVEAEKIVRLLGLKWTPIAGKFSDKPEKSEDSSKKLSICEAFSVVRQENLVLSISKDNCTCPGGRHFTGLEIVPPETIVPVLTTKRHRVYESTNTALTSVNKQPKPVNRGNFFTLGPLARFEADPDLVFLFTNPAQTDRILGLASFRGAEPFMYYPASSICSTITNVLAKERPEINLISFFERKGGKWSPDELMIAMPLKDFEESVKNIPVSGYGTAQTF